MQVRFFASRTVAVAILAPTVSFAIAVLSPISELDKGLTAEAASLNSFPHSLPKEAVRAGFTRHTEPGVYTIDYPADWLLAKPAASITSIQNRQPSGNHSGYPPNYVNTEIYFRSQSLEAATQHLLRTNDTRYQPGTLTKQGALTVGEKEAVRLWFEAGQFGEDRLVTLVRYADDQTAVVSSYFTSGETWSIPTLQNIHWSFRNN